MLIITPSFHSASQNQTTPYGACSYGQTWSMYGLVDCTHHKENMINTKLQYIDMCFNMQWTSALVYRVEPGVPVGCTGMDVVDNSDGRWSFGNLSLSLFYNRISVCFQLITDLCKHASSLGNDKFNLQALLWSHFGNYFFNNMVVLLPPKNIHIHTDTWSCACIIFSVANIEPVHRQLITVFNCILCKYTCYRPVQRVISVMV